MLDLLGADDHDPDRIARVAGEGGSFSLVHDENVVKIDVFVTLGEAAERDYSKRVAIALLPLPAPAI